MKSPLRNNSFNEKQRNRLFEKAHNVFLKQRNDLSVILNNVIILLIEF